MSIIESTIRSANLLLCATGTLVFGALLLFVILDREGYERQVEAFVMTQVEQEINQTIDPEFTKGLVEATGILSDRLRERSEAMKAQLRDGVHKFIVATIVALCDEECAARCENGCVDRDKLEAAIVDMYDKGLSRLKIGMEELRQKVEDKYASTHAELRTDILIFLSSSLAVMLMALMLAIFKGRASRHLLPLSIILALTTLFAASWYVFGQNWLLTIVYSDYLGWGYLTLLAGLFVLLCDIAFNRGLITIAVFNFFLEVLGSVFRLVPC